MFARWIVSLLAVLAAGPAALADSFTVTVKALADGKPAGGAQAALIWATHKGAMTPADDKPATTGADGTASLRVDDWSTKRPVVVMSADRKLGAVVAVSKADEGKEVTAT